MAGEVNFMKKSIKAVVNAGGTMRGTATSARTHAIDRAYGKGSLSAKKLLVGNLNKRNKSLKRRTVAIERGIGDKLIADAYPTWTKYNKNDHYKRMRDGIKGIVGMHELAERKASKHLPHSRIASITEVIGRAEHNNLRNMAIKKEGYGVRKAMKRIRLGEEDDKLKSLTPKNKKNVKIEYGNPESPRINRSLALRMSAKEHNIPVTMGAKDIRKALKSKEKSNFKREFDAMEEKLSQKSVKKKKPLRITPKQQRKIDALAKKQAAKLNNKE